MLLRMRSLAIQFYRLLNRLQQRRAARRKVCAQHNNTYRIKVVRSVCAYEYIYAQSAALLKASGVHAVVNSQRK